MRTPVKSILSLRGIAAFRQGLNIITVKDLIFSMEGSVKYFIR